MKRRFDELEGLRIEISETRRTQHLETIDEALRTVPTRRTGRVWSRRVAFATLALAVAIPAAALASENSVPGDLLYPVKRVIEPVRMLFDDDVAARHRVDELESLVDSGADTDVIDRQVEDARDALTDVEAPQLQRRFDGLVDRVRERHRSDQPGGELDLPGGESDQPIDRTTTTTQQDRPSETDDPGEHNRERDRNTTTTAPEDDGRSDRPRGDG